MDTVNRTKKDKDHPFVMTDKRIVDNPIISTSATGLMNYLLSKPDGWKFCETDIGRHFSDGRKELKQD